MALVNNPTQLATNAAALQRPLSAGLTSSVGNAVQGYLAERGLSQAPGIASETLAQGLAPYQLQEQQMALQSYLQSLGLPAAASARFLPYPQSTDMTKLFQSLFNPNGGSSASPSSSTFTANQPTMMQLTGGANPMPAGTVPSTTDWMGNSSTAPPPNMPPPDAGFNLMDLLYGGGGGLTPSLVGG